MKTLCLLLLLALGAHGGPLESPDDHRDDGAEESSPLRPSTIPFIPEQDIPQPGPSWIWSTYSRNANGAYMKRNKDVMICNGNERVINDDKLININARDASLSGANLIRLSLVDPKHPATKEYVITCQKENDAVYLQHVDKGLDLLPKDLQSRLKKIQFYSYVILRCHGHDDADQKKKLYISSDMHGTMTAVEIKDKNINNPPPGALFRIVANKDTKFHCKPL